MPPQQARAAMAAFPVVAQAAVGHQLRAVPLVLVVRVVPVL